MSEPSSAPVSAPVILTPEQTSARKRRNMMLALMLVAFMVLIFVLTLTQLKAGVIQGQM